MSPNDKPILYSYWRSSCSWRVRMALDYKEIEYDYRPVNLISKEDTTNPEFLKVNPAKKVPAMIIDGKSITESLAIIEYLEEAFPQKPLLPKDPIKRAHARAIALHVSSGIQPLQNLCVIQTLNQKEAGAGAKWSNHWITEGFKSLEQLLHQHSGKYCVGDEITIADLVIPSIVYNANRFKVDLTPFPTIRRINEAIEAIPEFQKSHPDGQPDAGLNN